MQKFKFILTNIIILLVFISCNAEHSKISEDSNSSIDKNNTKDIANQPTKVTTESVYAPKLQLKEGDYWKYKWQQIITTSGQGINTNIENSYNEFIITLGKKTFFNGREVFPILLTGESETYAPRWKYLTIDENGDLLGSINGAYQTIYSASKSEWLGGGFFIKFKNDDMIKVHTTTYNGIYNTFKAKEITYKDASGGCEYLLGYTLCSDSSANTNVKEYYKQGLGTVGLYEYSYYTYNGGNFYTAHKKELYIELIESSLSSLDGTILKKPNWKEIAILPKKIQNYTVTNIDNKIYITSTNNNFIQVYNTLTKKFEKTISIPSNQNKLFLHTLNNKLYLLDYKNGIREYINKNSWKYINNFKDGNIVTSTFNYNDNNKSYSYIISMFSDNSLNSKLEISLFDPYLNSWQSFINPKTNYSRWGWYDIIVVDNILYLIGGTYLSNSTWNTWSTHQYIERFDIIHNTWLSGIKAPTTHKSGSALLNFNGKMAILGGKDENSQILSSVEVYDPVLNNWENLEPLPKPLNNVKAVYINKKIYLITSEKIWSYSPSVY